MENGLVSVTGGIVSSYMIIEFYLFAVVTGCTRGIGYCYAFELAQRGLNMILIARNTKVLEKMAQEMRDKHNVKVEIIEADFTGDVYDGIEKSLKGKDIGILVNNVGLFFDKPQHFNDLDTDYTKQLLSTNIDSLTLMCKIVLPMMEKKGRGAIVNIASQLGFSPAPLFSVYSASKAYVIYLSRAIAAEYKDKGITIQTVCPGGVDTGMLKFLPDSEKPKLFVPSPETYAASCVRTLGFSNFTCGYWFHGFFALSVGLLSPEAVYKMMKNKWLAMNG